MADTLVQSVQDMLKEETWTRATISSYTQNDLKELTEIVEKAKDENCASEIQELCEEHLTHSKDSIIALYLAGIFSLQRGGIDNSTHLETLVDIFQNNHKESIVHYLCDTIIEDDPNNKFALRTLANSYLAENNEEYWNLYEKIVRVDDNEADLAKTLAEHFEEAGDKDKALDYYKKAIHRYISNGNYNGTKDIWTKFVQEIPGEIDFFNVLKKKISKAFGEYKTTTLMQELYSWYKDNGKWDVAIDILKQNLEVDPKDIWARKEITDCYKAKYADHSHLEEYIKSSNLTASYRNVFEAINDFEKHIAFDKGSFVAHREWGIGRIKKLEKDNLVIYFGKATGERTMSLKMAVTALEALPKDHIWVKKATTKKEELVAYAKNNKEEILKQIIKSFNNDCDFKRIKAEIVPSILSASEWTSWNSAAKKILESNPSFAVTQTGSDHYMVRENEITTEEKLHEEFKSQKQFFARIDILMRYLNNDSTNKEKEEFNEMYMYFVNMLKNVSKVDEQIIAAHLVVRAVTSFDKNFAVQSKYTFADLYNRLPFPGTKEDKDARGIYNSLKDTKNTNLKADFIECIKMLPNWNEEYIKLFPTVLDGALINDLISNNYVEDVQKLVRTSFDSSKDFRDTVIYFFKNCQEEDWFKNAGVSYEKQLITLLGLGGIAQKEIDNHVNSTDNKKLQVTIDDMLFKKEALFKYIFAKEGDLETVTKFYTIIADCEWLDNVDSNTKQTVRARIAEKFPEFQFRQTEEKVSSKPKGMLVTNKKLAEKKAEIDRLQNEEIPKNTKDVAEAKAKGDLKENAEYHAARERQHMLNLNLSKLQEELNRATVFDPTTCTTSAVSFGTVVTLLDEATSKTTEVTLLGPWESDPENQIISYLSPFGNAILDKKVGESASYSIDGKKFKYTIKAINKANI